MNTKHLSALDIFVVDHDLRFSQNLHSRLKSNGLSVFLYKNPEKFLTELSQSERLPHVCLLNVDLLGISALSLAKRIKKTADDISVVFYGANVSSDYFEWAALELSYVHVLDSKHGLESLEVFILKVLNKIYEQFYLQKLIQEKKHWKQLDAEDFEFFHLSTLKNSTSDELIFKFLSYFLDRQWLSHALYFSYDDKKQVLKARNRAPEDFLAGAMPTMSVSPDVFFSKSNHAFEEAFDSLVTQALLMETDKSSALDQNKAKYFRLNSVGKSGLFVFFGENVEKYIGRIKFFLNYLESYLEFKSMTELTQEFGAIDLKTGFQDMNRLKLVLEKEFVRHQRLEHPFSLIYVSMLNNDVSQFSRSIKYEFLNSFRRSDDLFLLSENSFVVFMPHTEYSQACKKYDDFIEILKKSSYESSEFRLKLIEYPRHVQNIEELFSLFSLHNNSELDGSNVKKFNLIEASVAESYLPPFKSKKIETKTIKQPSAL